MKTSINFSPVKAIKLAFAGFGFAVFLSPQHLAALQTFAMLIFRFRLGLGQINAFQ